MNRPRLIMHVGLPKCGSTSIQLRLASNRDRLFNQGIFYPSSPTDESGMEPIGHMPLAASLTRLGGRSPLLVQALEEYRASGADTLCLSSESFLMRTPAIKRESIGDEFDGFETSLIAFYRRHDGWIISRYKQAVVKQGYAGTLADFVETPPRGHDGMVGFDIPARLARLADVFGATRLRIVDLDSDDVDAVGEMGALLDVPLTEWKADPSLLSPTRTHKLRGNSANVSLGNLATLFLRDLNALDVPTDLLEAIRVALYRNPAPETPTRLMGKEVAERLRDTFVRTNQLLYERHGRTPHATIEPGDGPFRDTLEPEEREQIALGVLDSIDPPMRDSARSVLAVSVDDARARSGGVGGESC